MKIILRILLILIILGSSHYANAATRLSTATGQTAGSNGASSFTVSPTITAGQSGILVVSTQLTTITVSTVTQTNVTWTLAVAYNATALGGDTEIWYASSAGASPGATITVNLGASGQAGGVEATYDTALTGSFVDKTASNGGISTASASTGTTSSTTQASEVWVGGITVPDNTSLGYGYSSPTNGFTIVVQGDWTNLNRGLTHYGYLDQIVTTTGTASTGATISPAAGAYSAAIATFKFASTGAGLLSIMGCGT